MFRPFEVMKILWWISKDDFVVFVFSINVTQVFQQVAKKNGKALLQRSGIEHHMMNFHKLSTRKPQGSDKLIN